MKSHFSHVWPKIPFLKPKLFQCYLFLSPLGFQWNLFLVIFWTKFRFDKSMTRSTYGKKTETPNLHINTIFCLSTKLRRFIMNTKMNLFKWKHSFEHKTHFVKLQFKENFLYLTLFRFPILTITAAKLNLMWFHWNYSIFFETKPGFKEPFRCFCWFQ